MPFALEAVAFTLLYLIAPNRRVKFSDALIGGVVAAGIFEIVKYAFALYLFFFPTYEAIYGAVAAIPIFLLWIYCCWATVLLGAEITAEPAGGAGEAQAEIAPQGKGGIPHSKKNGMPPFRSRQVSRR